MQREGIGTCLRLRTLVVLPGSAGGTEQQIFLIYIVNYRFPQKWLQALIALGVLAVALYTVKSFILSMLWAAILCVATWPLYIKTSYILRRPVVAALAVTFLTSLILLVPAAVGLTYGIHEAPVLAEALARANNSGITPPIAWSSIPFVGSAMEHWWGDTLGQPGWLPHLLLSSREHELPTARRLLRIAGFDLLQAGAHVAFTYLTLFFLYRDGRELAVRVRVASTRLLGEDAWHRYLNEVPAAIRATVVGLLLVGLGEGILIGGGYLLAGVPSPVTWAIATAVLGAVPFGAPVVFLAAAAVLWASGHSAGAVAVAAWGTLVLFVADHFVRPRIIGESTHQPFLAILFGILGGVEQFGLVGLFLGPVITGIVVTMWRVWSSSRDIVGSRMR